MPSLLQRLIIDYPSLFHRDHIISSERIALQKTLIIRIIMCAHTEIFFLLSLFWQLGIKLGVNIKRRKIRRNNKKDSGHHGYIDSWGGWISDPRSVSGRWRCFTIKDNTQKTIRQFQAAFPGGINRPSFKPSALLVLPFLNPRRHHPAAARASSLHVHVTYEYGVTTLIIEVSRKTSM